MRKRVNNNARPRKGHPHAFKDYNDDGIIQQSKVGLLENIWRGAPSDSCFFLATSDPDGKKWREHVIHGDNIRVGLNRFFRNYSRWDNNQYFCANAFSEPRRKRQYALPTRFSHCDMDESDPEEYDPWASLVWETSPDRYQALWSWDKTHDASEAERFSKALAYRHGGDKNGWSATKMLRVPGSVNHKPQYDEPFVRMVHYDWTEIVSRPLPLKGRRHNWPASLADVDANPNRHDRLNVLKKYRQDLHPKVCRLIRDRKAYEPDRSAQVFHIVAGLHEAGASHDEIASVLWDSPYFIDKYGQDIGKLNDEIGRVIGKLEGGR